MCRLLAIVADASIGFRHCLHEAPRSLAGLSREHPDGWGIALSARGSAWTLHKSVARAGEDARFLEIAGQARGEVLVAHVRQRTVGRVRIANTHPFRRGRWVFAHNGTIEDTDFLGRRTSTRRAREVEGDTDSEQLFAYLLTCVDVAASVAGDGVEAVDAGVLRAISELVGHGPAGSLNFVLSNGETLYAYRNGRPLLVLERHRGASTTAAILIASEAVTDELWRPLPQGTLLRVDREPAPRLRPLVVHPSRSEAAGPAGSESPC